MNSINDLHTSVWRKARKSSANGSCVEVALVNVPQLAEPEMAVRDSKLPTEGSFPHLRVDAATWRGLIAHCKDGSIS